MASKPLSYSSTVSRFAFRAGLPRYPSSSTALDQQETRAVRLQRTAAMTIDDAMATDTASPDNSSRA